jgi:hypothetical protein
LLIYKEYAEFAMIQKELLLKYKELFYKNKKDVRYLKDAVLLLLNEKNVDPEHQDCVGWIGDEIANQFKKKSYTQGKNAEIGALVAHVVFYGADVLPTIKAIAEWLGIAETTVRDGYYKIKKTYNFEPKKAASEDFTVFLYDYDLTPIYIASEQFKMGKRFPGTGSDKNHEYWQVWQSMIAAHDAALEREKIEKGWDVNYHRLHELNTQK